ncbi:hypothetical protein QVG61_07950 [Thiohalobacter sp. IOR34]|uniref:hypothetical protein n=1 Tax=Thiohalobacter sp. IOR34 TaxID=3057176 RepID=UPI0025AF746B|nr:hypothetical protein [Thiohalobacter sp. IOR34]WJW74450.1 hypothetical protein QVG61_07950 [Thiohalobacter sp. IOR34]
MAVRAEFPKTEADFSLLPPYCKVKMRQPRQSPEWRMWSRRLAGGFNHIHHYCAALHSINLANRSKRAQRRKELLTSAYKDMVYVEEHAARNFVLRPEILVKKGKVLERLGKAGEAVTAYQQAIRLNTKYSPAYIALADYYKSVGKRDLALDIVEKGIEQAPRSKGLRRRLRELRPQ